MDSQNIYEENLHLAKYLRRFLSVGSSLIFESQSVFDGKWHSVLVYEMDGPKF